MHDAFLADRIGLIGLGQRPGKSLVQLARGPRIHTVDRVMVNLSVLAHERQYSLRAVEQALAAFQDLVERRGGVGHRTADDLKHFRGCGLPRQRLLRLVEEARVFHCDQRLISKRFSLGDFARAEDIGPPSAHREQPDAFLAAQKRQVQHRIDAEHLVDAAFVFWQVDLRPVRQVQHRLGEEGARGKVGARVDRDALGSEVRDWTLRRRPGRMDVGVAFAKQHERHVAPEQTRGGDNDPFEHRPRVGRRLADDAEDLGRRGLPRQRLLRLVDEPCVLHRDLRLDGEGLRERDLPVAERPGRLAPEHDNSEDDAVLAHRHSDESPDPAKFDACNRQGIPLAVSSRL